MILEIRESHCDLCGLTMVRDENSAIDTLRLSKEKILTKFIIKCKKHKRCSKTKITGKDCAGYMPMTGKAVPQACIIWKAGGTMP